METSLVIKSKDTAQKEVTKSLTNINPNVSNANLKTAAQMFTSISSGTYYSATRVDKTDVDEQTGKTEPTLTVSDNSYTYNGDGEIFGYSPDGAVTINRTNKTFFVNGSGGSTLLNYTIYLCASEGTNYASKTASYNK